MSRIRRKRLPMERPKAHDWEQCVVIHSENLYFWKCRKCGIEALSKDRPNLYGTVGLYGIGTESSFNESGPGLHCDAYIAWQVTET